MNLHPLPVPLPVPSSGARLRRATWLLIPALAFATAALAAPDGRPERGDRPDRPERVERIDRPDRGGPPPQRDARPNPPGQRDFNRPGARNDRWYDSAYGHNRSYPPPGRVVTLPPRPPAPVYWGGVNYRYWDGIWATSGPRGWVTVRPPIGVVTLDLPSWRTAVLIGGLSYYYVNGVYYRDHLGGGYEVVSAPVAQPDPAPPDRSFIYPRQGQTAQQQASDEYECHRWAVSQSGFDPSGNATGQSTTYSTTGRSDYQRAQGACLEGRGYTVR